MTYDRDSKGRFCKKNNNNTTTNNSNKKGDNTMKTMNNKETRMAALNNAGINTENFFNINMNIPVGANVQITIDGVPYEIKSSNNDAIVKQIMDEGYVYNPKTDGRWVAAQTFKLLNGSVYNYKTKQYEYGWDACVRLGYTYMYQFEMMIDELHRLSKMERDHDVEFEVLKNFFTKEVVIETCRQYVRQLKKYIENQPNRKHKGRPYVRLNKYYNVHKDELNVKVYNRLEEAIFAIQHSENYAVLERCLREFVNIAPKLPAETPKCSEWKDAFKGNGAYKTLNNIIKHHGVVVQNYETGEILDRDGSLAYVESLVDTYKGQYWKLHELLKETIELNNFDLRKSIEAQNK